MCQVLGVSTSGYYAWRKRAPSARAQANQRLVAAIRRIHAASRGSYGSPRIHAELLAQGFQVSENRVARLMRAHAIRARRKPGWRPSTDSRHSLAVAPNLLRRNFQAQAPNQKWLADLTYIRTGQGWLHLAVVLDLFSRKIVGWAMHQTLTSHLVSQALTMALQNRPASSGLLHHSDRGVQYAAADYQQLLAQYQIQASMSRTGNVYDNAPMESFFSTLKCEHVHWQHYRTRAEARTDIFGYIEGFYNRIRRHSALGYLSPEQFERQHFEFS